MRDPKAYKEHGRNDPLTPDQLREHPYDFVSLPDQPATGEAVLHDRYHRDRLTGTLYLVYTTVTPLHVGSGVFETAKECGLSPLGKFDSPVRGIMRRRGRPALPGSGWKGAVRARFEAITRSRLVLVDHSSNEPAFKVPDALNESKIEKGKFRVSIDDSRVTSALRARGTVRSVSAIRDLCPADALFGCMGYRGRVHPNDGEIVGPAARKPLQVAPLDSPVMHRLAKPGKAESSGRNITISEVEGRKFYYDGPIVHARKVDDGASGPPSRFAEPANGGRYELIDSVLPENTIRIEAHVDSLTRAELGALLVAAGYGDGVGVVRFGGFKSVGLGKVRLVEARAEIDQGISTRRWRRAASRSLDLDEVVKEARESTWIDLAALDELHQITTRERPQ